MNPNSVLCGPVCGFGGQVGERHHRSPRPALLKPCEPVVSSSCQRQLPRETLEYEVSVFSCGKAQGFSLVKIQTKGAESRQKSRPSRARKGSALEHGITSMDAESSPTKKWVWRGLRAAHITPTLSRKKRV